MLLSITPYPLDFLRTFHSLIEKHKQKIRQALLKEKIFTRKKTLVSVAPSHSIIFFWVPMLLPITPHPLLHPKSPSIPCTIISSVSIPGHQISVWLQSSTEMTYLSINNSNYTCVDSHCWFKCNMKWMLHCCHLKDCYDNHTDNVNITLPPVCIITFILCVFYEESAEREQNYM